MAAYRRVDDLTVTCRLTACTPGSAPGQRSVSSMGSLYLILSFCYTFLFRSVFRPNVFLFNLSTTCWGIKIIVSKQL